MELEPIEHTRSDKWDLSVRGCEGSQIYHESPWLAFLQETQPGRLHRFQLMERGEIAGYLPGMVTQKGFFTLFGSPLFGWFTDSMGPVARQGFDAREFVGAMEKLCHRWRIDFVQIGGLLLPPDLMHSLGYEVTEMKILSIPLSESIDEMWNALDSKCRNRIRKGLRNSLEVRECSDENFVDEYYMQHVEVFRRQGLPAKYPARLVRSLYKNLSTHGQLLCLRVLHGEETVATGLFPHDGRQLYSFGIASRTSKLELCPNELLYWTAMQWGGQRGLRSFGIGGNYRTPKSGGNFKRKFGCREVSIFRYAKAFSAAARLAHRAHRLILECNRRYRVLRPVRYSMVREHEASSGGGSASLVSCPLQRSML